VKDRKCSLSVQIICSLRRRQSRLDNVRRVLSRGWGCVWEVLRYLDISFLKLRDVVGLDEGRTLPAHTSAIT
jgi:hypothetical protein